MKAIWIERREVNVELLDAQLREVGKDSFYGLSTGRGGVTLYVSEEIEDKAREALMEIARAHDATRLTPQQQEAHDRQRMLEWSRADAALDLSAYVESSPEIHALAHKVAWLEQELRDLRGM